MTQNNIAGHLRVLEGLLDAERHAIRNGEFEGLSQLSEKKEKLLDRLEQSDLSAKDLGHLRSKAEANQRLLAAAIKGVRAARRRLEMIRQAAHGLNTYNSQGQARTIGSSVGSFERRA